ncbi:MAG: peptidyl-prolyl cis-trans isomerase [Bacteroides sp.]
MRITDFLLIPFLVCMSCAEKHDPDGQTPLVKVDGYFLYKADLHAVLPAGLSKEDSTLFAEHYIRNWVEETLLYKKAQSNIPDNSEIDRLVENYRKALIMHSYQQKLISQKLSDEIPEEELTAFYTHNQELFKLEHPLIKGLFIKVPLTSPQLSSVRKWYKNESREAVDHLEKYSLQNAVKYEYFYDKWVPVADVLDLIPLKDSTPETYVNENRYIELKDTAFYYFLHVSDFRAKGEQEPYELALKQINGMLVNRKQVDFMKQVKRDLYQQAMDKKKIIYNY